MHLTHCLGIKHINHNLSCLLKIILCLARLYLANNDDILLINCSDEILYSSGKQAAYRLKCIDILLILCLYYIDNSLRRYFNMKLLCAIIYIYQQQVIKKQVLNEVILVKTLFVCN